MIGRSRWPYAVGDIGSLVSFDFLTLAALNTGSNSIGRDHLVALLLVWSFCSVCLRAHPSGVSIRVG